VLRSNRHASPVLELPILRVRAFALASVGAATFFGAFAAMLLSNVLFLTSVWGYSTIEAGLALTPGPLAAAVLARVSGGVAARFGPGRVGALGALLFALGSAWWIWQVGPEPSYWADFLPGMLIGGMGVGLVMPSFTMAAAATLPPARIATGIGAQTMFRQIGGALGVAAFVAILGTPAQGEVLGAFDDTRWFMVAASVATAVAMVGIVAPRPAAAPAPEAAPATLGS
jgi:Na+/melibiose symporter-like transporter